MNPETFSVYDGDNGYIPDPQRLQSIVSRYLKNAKRYLRNVSVGKFP
jgi:hypothetical protein